MSNPLPTSTVGETTRMCGICQSHIRSGEPATACPECQATYHADCWTENGGCAVYGCAQVPATEKREGVEVPAGYWGQDKKPCPVCGTQILAAAVRCRVCGATFKSARPQHSVEYAAQVDLDRRKDSVQRTVIWIFVLCVVPLTAPVGAVFGWVWYGAHHRDLRTLPSLYPALCKIGIGVGTVMSAMLMLFTILFAMFRG